MHAESPIYSSRDWTTTNSRFSRVPWRRSPSIARLAEEAGVVVQSEVVSEQKVGFRPTVALQAFAPGHRMPHSCMPRSQKPQSAARNLRSRHTEGGPRAARKPGSIGVSSFL